MKVRLTRTKTDRTVANEKTTGETIDEWYLELDLDDAVLGWETVGPLFKQMIDECREWLRIQDDQT